jgi:hypothetical protein
MSDQHPEQNLAVAEYSLLQHLKEIQAEHRLDELAVAFYDYETSIRWSYNADLWFHAASTMKLAAPSCWTWAIRTRACASTWAGRAPWRSWRCR